MKNFFNDDDEKLKWETKQIKTIQNTVVFELTEQENVSKNGVSGKYIIMNAPDWVITIPEKNGKFLMVKQWRHGAKKLSVEFPGGVIDKGEEPESAAARELQEETGYKAGKLTKIGCVNPNPALFSNKVHVYLAEDLTATGKQNLDHDEFINYIELPKADVFENMGLEQMQHGIMGTALFFYMQHKKLFSK